MFPFTVFSTRIGCVLSIEEEPSRLLVQISSAWSRGGNGSDGFRLGLALWVTWIGST